MIWKAFGGQNWGRVGIASLAASGTIFSEGNPAMAWLEAHPTSGHYKICFRSGGRKLKKTIKTESQKDAETALAQYEENLGLLERGASRCLPALTSAPSCCRTAS